HDCGNAHASRRLCRLTLMLSSPAGLPARAARNAPITPLFFPSFAMFLEVPRPDPASHDAAQNAYVLSPDGTIRHGRIDLYSAVLSFSKPSNAADPTRGPTRRCNTVFSTPSQKLRLPVGYAQHRGLGMY